jgi:DNA-nicking Smr family endonuclease
VGLEPKERDATKPQGAASTNPPIKRLLPPLEVLTGREANRMLKPHGRAQATLDLHGMGKLDAYEAVRDFVADAHASGARHIAIITGKGRTSDGILRANLPHWLNEMPLRRVIGSITQASPERGGAGVFHVLLKRA